MCSVDFCSTLIRLYKTAKVNILQKNQIRVHKEFDSSVVNKMVKLLLTMMIVKKCIWNVQRKFLGWQIPDQTNMKHQIWFYKEFDHTVVNKTGEGLLMMMMVKKCIWNVQPDAAAHFFPSTQSMNHRADENAPRRCTRFFSSYLTGLHYDELFFEQASAVRIHSGQKGYQQGLYCCYLP